MRTIAVTGSASGIGAATKTLLESEGNRVIGIDLRDADVVADLSKPDDRVHAVNAVLAATGAVLDGLVMCAGVGGTAPAELAVRVNYYGTMAVVEGLRGALVAGHEPSVVMVSSNTTTMTPGLSSADARVFLDGDEDSAIGYFADKGYRAYPAGKLAVAYWTRSNAAGWIADGVRLNAVAPGVIRTGMTAEVEARPDLMASLEQIPIPIGRWGRPEELAAAIGFLLSASSSYVVGQVLFADGGTDAVLRPFAHPRPTGDG